LLWMDDFNYSGLRGKVPRELTGDSESEQASFFQKSNVFVLLIYFYFYAAR
jgi:hypothetical protein